MVIERTKVFVNQAGAATRSLGDLKDVDTTGVANGAVLVYDSALGKFVTTTVLTGVSFEGIVIGGGTALDGGTF